MLTLISAMQLKKPEIFMFDFTLPLERTCFPWVHLQGQTQNIAKIQNQILLPLKQHLLTSKKSSNNFFPSSKIILFHGIRTSGKTFMAKTLGAELKRIYWDTNWTRLQTFYIHATDLVTSHIDDTKNKMSRIFQRIQQQSNSQPSFIIIDDLHKLFSSSFVTFNSAGVSDVTGVGNRTSNMETYSTSPASPAGQDRNIVHEDALILNHLCTCIEHLKGDLSGRSGQTEKVGGTTYVILIMSTDTSAPFNFLQLQDHLDLDLSLPFYTMDKQGRLSFFQRFSSNLNSCPAFQLSPQTLDFLVKNTLGFTCGDLVKLKNLTIVQSSAAAAKKLANLSQSKSKSGRGKRDENFEVDADDWLRALHHFHSHGQSHRLQNILLTPSHQISMNFETAFQILSCPDVVLPLVQQNFDVIVNLIRSKIRVHDKILKGSQSNSRLLAGTETGTESELPFNNMSSSSAGMLMNPQEPSYSEDPGLPSGSELSLTSRILYLHLPNPQFQVQGQGQMSMEFVNKYVIPAVVTRGFSDMNMPSFVIHGEAIISQNIPPFVIINMLKEARQFESPCFLIINSLHLIISNPKFKGDINNLSTAISKCAYDCGSSSNIFIIATSTVEISKLPPCLQDIFHGYQNSYWIQNTSEQEIQDFLYQAIFDPEPPLIPFVPNGSNQNPGCQFPPTGTKTPVDLPSKSPLVTAQNSEEDGSCDPYSNNNNNNNNVNNSLINLSLLLNQNQRLNSNSEASSSRSGGKTVTTIKGPSAGFSKNGSCNDTSVLQSRRETSRRKLNNHHSCSGKTLENPQENEQSGSPSSKIMRLDPNQILDRAVAVAVKMNQKSIIWFYEDLMRVKRAAAQDKHKVLKHQEQIVQEAEEAQKPLVSRKSSRNLSTNPSSSTGKNMNSSTSSNNMTRSTRKKTNSSLKLNDSRSDESDDGSDS